MDYTDKSIYKRYIPAVVAPEGDFDLAYFFVFNTNHLLVKMEKDSAKIPLVRDLKDLALTSIRCQYLGTLEGYPCYSVEASPDSIPPEGMCLMELRSLFGLLEEDVFWLATKAMQIVCWDETHQFCGKCGTATRLMTGERAKVCPKCGFASFPRLSPATITAVIKDGQILLAHAKHFRENMYSIIAGFVEPGETLEECVKREIMEEVGIEVDNIRYFGSQPWPFPNSLMLGFTAEYKSGEITVDGVEIGDAGWFTPANLPEIPSKLSIARKLIDWYVETYKDKTIKGND